MLESYIEMWIVSEIHSLEKGVKIKTTDFLTAIYRELSNKYEDLRSPVETIDVVNINPKEALKAEALRQGIRNYEDQDHIASAIEYQYTTDKWVIFLTYDEKDILNNAQRLRDICVLYVSKPIYAVDHKRELSKNPSPVNFFRGLKDLTPSQKSFARVLLNTLGIRVFLQ